MVVVCCLLCVVRRLHLSFAARCSLRVVCCLLCVVYYLLRAECLHFLLFFFWGGGLFYVIFVVVGCCLMLVVLVFAAVCCSCIQCVCTLMIDMCRLLFIV